MVEVADGHVVQTSMVGRDDVIGAPQALDDKVSLNKIVVQTPGTASVIDRDYVREAVRAASAIRNVFAAYEQFFVADIHQTAVCNALHPVEARMCRWLVRTMDLGGTNVQLTQEQIAAMIGVRRTSVSQAAIRFSHLVFLLARIDARHCGVVAEGKGRATKFRRVRYRWYRAPATNFYVTI